MDLQEQNELANQIETVLEKKLKGKEFHAIIAVEEYGTGFAFAITTLDKTATFQSCSFIANGINDKAKELIDRFKIPSDAKFKMPIEPKV